MVVRAMHTLRRLDTLLLIALLALALALRLWHLGEQSLWIDEAAAFAMSAGSPADVLRTALEHPLDLPLERFILNPLTRYPPDEFLFRLPAALWGVLGAALTYILARQIWDAETALLAAGLLALSPYNIRYSQEARNYTSFLALQLLTLISLVRAVRRPARANWTLYALAAGTVMYDHLYSFIILAWQFGLHALLVLLAAWRRERTAGLSWRTLRDHLLALLGAGALFLPWAVYLLSGSSLLQRMSALNGLFRAPESIRFDADLFLRMLSWFMTDSGEAAPAVRLTLAGTAGALALPPARQRRWALLGALYIFGTFLTVAVLSRFTNTYLAYRRLLFLQPLLFILLAGGCTALIRRIWGWLARRDWPAAGALVPALLLLAIGLTWAPAIANHYRSEKENWRDAALVLRTEAEPQDWVVNCADSPN
ncbi:MAG: glycosyltransferase family 39 protein, partial [Anaerolineae bacterium]